MEVRAVALFAMLCAAGCAQRSPQAAYVPRARDVTVTTIPLVTKELQSVYPFLKQDFAKGGVLDGKEVYGFLPSTITVVEGDTIRFTFINPEDDLHSFVLPDLAVSLPGQTTVKAVYVARRAGLFDYVCSVASHLPMMHGQLVVLPRSIGAQFAASH